MRIAIIGGRYGNKVQLERLARQAGHELEVRDGDLHGLGVQEIRTAVVRSDITIILTAPNSHGAVSVAKAVAKQLGTPSVILDRLSVARFRALLDAVHRRKELGWPWPSHEAEELLCGASGALLRSTANRCVRGKEGASWSAN